jgi:hypothetical protein
VAANTSARVSMPVGGKRSGGSMSASEGISLSKDSGQLILRGKVERRNLTGKALVPIGRKALRSRYCVGDRTSRHICEKESAMDASYQ